MMYNERIILPLNKDAILNAIEGLNDYALWLPRHLGYVTEYRKKGDDTQLYFIGYVGDLTHKLNVGIEVFFDLMERIQKEVDEKGWTADNGKPMRVYLDIY